MEGSQKTEEKMLYVMRGLPGSGKSTLANELGKGGVVLSTDDFFIDTNGKYVYNGKQIKNAHAWNKQRAQDALVKGVTPIVIDNTNTQKWEAKYYVQQALIQGYRVVISEPQTPWRRNPSELAKRNTHLVPEETIGRMLAKWEEDFTVESVMASQDRF